MIGNQMELSDWLDDLCVRFIINLPEEDLSSVARICFQVEEAQWFYEDFIRPLDPNLPSMTLRTFCLRLFQHCPLLATFSVENHTRAFEEFLQYKTRVPVRGAILLNHEMDSTVLVKGWKKGASWSFPRGKINKDEDDLDCAVREVWEETGLDLRAAGLVPTESNPKFIEITMREQQMRLYIFRDVPMETKFQPQTRKEISKIQWYKLSELPAFRKKGGQNNGTNNGPDASASASKFYMVAPFLVPLKKWVLSQKKIATRQTSMTVNQNNFNPHFSVDEAPTEDDAWPQVVPSVTAPAPELDTLEGATHELQRLLKVQPPTQGSAMQEDKAIALLSMLKLGGASRPGQSQGNSHIPQTPLDLTASEAPYPRNPHHHTNQHQQVQMNQPPPPAFTLPQHQQHQGPSWNMAQHHPHPGKFPPQEFGAVSQQPRGNHQAPLVHPQPLPPQVQRSVYNKSTFQDQQPNLPSQHIQLPPPPQQQPQLEPPPEYVPQIPPQQNMPSNGERPRLDGQSLALLHAFKRDTGNSPSTQLKEHPGATHSHLTTQLQHRDSQPPATQNQPRPSELAGSSATQNLPMAILRPNAHAPADQHRSTLLGMFKNGGASTPPQGASQSQRGHIDGAGIQKQLLDTLVPSGSATPPQTIHHSPNPSAALSDFLALKPHAGQLAPTKSRTSNHTPPSRRQPARGDNPPAHPVRILQRPQGADALDFARQPEKAMAPSPYLGQSHPVPGNYASPPVVAARPSPGGYDKPPEASQDQKRQLLSLFGKQQAGPNAAAPSAVEGGSDHGSTTRPGSGPPMSSADQTFLLDYLQSVTGNASR